MRLAKRNRVPFFLTPFLHLGDPTNANDRTRAQYTAPHLRWLLRQADGVFVQTQREYDTALSLGVAASRLVLQGLGVEPRECTGGNRDAARTSWRVLPQTVVVGHLANNSAEKGTIDLLRAAELAWNRGVEFRVVLAGPEMPNFRNFWEKYRYQDRVVRLGTLSETAKRDFLAGIDSFALPSRSDSFGLVLLEAWANAKPNVVYAAGGPGELVQHGRDGLQAKCGDVNDLANQLCLLLENQSLRESLGAAGLARLASEFDWSDKLALFRDRVECLTRDWAHRGSGQVTAGVSCP